MTCREDVVHAWTGQRTLNGDDDDDDDLPGKKAVMVCYI